MKKLITMLIGMITFLSVFGSATESKVAVDCQTPGTLSSLLTYVQQQNVTDLTVSGYLNESDISFINKLITDNINLSFIDLGNATSIDGAMPFSFNRRIPLADDSPQTYTKPVKRLSMPRSEEFNIELSSSGSLIDTLIINSRVVKRGCQGSSFKKVILGNTVEELDFLAFTGSGDAQYKSYIVDSLPSSLRIIDEQAFFFGSVGDISESKESYLSPDIELPKNIERIGKAGVSGGEWNNRKFVYNRPTIILPETLKVWVGATSRRMYPGSDTRYYYYPTILKCDTLIVPQAMEQLQVKIEADVAVFYCAKPATDFYREYHINKMYVPREYLEDYRTQFDEYVNNKQIGEILPIQNVERILLSAQSSTLYIGDKTSISAEILPVGALFDKIKWSSSDDAVAVVDNNGVVTAVSPGIVGIHAIAENGVEGTIDIEVLQHVSGLSISPKEISLTELGQREQLSAVIEPISATDKTIKWISSSPNICHVSNTGQITALSYGFAVITAITNDGGFEDYCLVNVIKPVKSIVLSQETATLDCGSSLHLEAIINPEDATNKTLRWHTSNSDVATVDSNGIVTAVNQGNAVIMVETSDGSNLQASCLVSVIQPVSDIVLEYSSITLEVGDEKYIDTYVLPDDATNKNISWQSVNPEIAAVSDGTVRAISEGETLIIVSAMDNSGINKTCSVLVDKSTGVSDAAINHPVIQTQNGSIIVRNVANGTEIEICTLSGSEVLRTRAQNAIVLSPQLTPGMYVVKIDGKTTKIVIQ